MNFSDARIDILVRACAESGNEEAWAEFIHRFGKVIEAMVAKACGQWGRIEPEIIDDTIQETYLKICDHGCRVLKEFDERHPDSIYGLLKAVAFSVVQDRYRFANARKRGAGIKLIPLNEVLLLADAPDPDLGILMAEVDRELQTSTLRDRTIFWLYFRHGLTTRAIAGFSSFGLSQKGVETVIERLTKYLRSRLVIAASRSSEGKTSRSAF